jgi:hypothetical protein
MLVVPLAAVPSQTVDITLALQPAHITVRTIGSKLYFSLDGVAVNRICRDRQRLLVDSQYRGFVGDFAFVDTQGADDPTFAGLGSRYQLVYYNAGE